MAADDEQVSAALERIAAIAGAIAGGSIGLAVGSDPYATHALSTVGEAALEEAFRWAMDRRRERAVDMFEHATAASGLPLDEFVEALVTDERLVDLLAAALDAATRAATEERRRAIGTALANGTMDVDDAEIDLEVLVARALGDLEVPHVRVVRYIDRYGNVELGQLRQSEELAPLAQGIDGIIAVLRSHGLIDAMPIVGTSVSPDEFASGVLARWQNPSRDKLFLTKLGRLVLGRYDAAGGEGAASTKG